MNITLDQLSKILPGNPNVDDWLDAINTTLPNEGITTVDRLSAFLSQTGHESADYTRLSENLNYSAAGLVATWPSRFTSSTAAAYARQPAKIANKVYANRLGNGNEASGDGWNYRGRGILQLTGKSNYAACSLALFGDDTLVKHPDLLSTDKTVALRSACWFWTVNHLNKFADSGDIATLSKKINGGQIGIKQRIAKFATVRAILQEA